MDSNHDKQIQNLLCYRYTTRQFEAHKHWLCGLFPKSSPIGTRCTNPSSSVEGTWIMHIPHPLFNLNHSPLRSTLFNTIFTLTSVPNPFLLIAAVLRME